MRHLLLLAAAVTVATFLVRLVLPFETDNKYVDLNMWEWPACAALFGLGILHLAWGGCRLCRTDYADKAGL